MPLHRFTKTNFFVMLIILLGIIAVLAVSAFFLAYSFPSILASPPPHFETREIYSFEPWAFDLDGLKVSFPEGGTIVPLYIAGKQFGVLCLGFGRYYLPESILPSINPTGFFAALTEKEMEEKQGNVIFMPVEKPSSRRHTLTILERQVVLPVLWESVIPLTFHPVPGSLYYYFLDETGNPILPPVLPDQSGQPLPATLLYLLFFAMILLVLLICAPEDRCFPEMKQFPHPPPRKTNLAVLFPVLLLAQGGELLPSIGITPAFPTSAGYWTAAALLLLFFRLGWIDCPDFGLHRKTFSRGYPMALAAAIILTMVTNGIPKGFTGTGWSTATGLIRFFIVFALAREMIWRGYIQTTLSRHFGSTAGLALTVLLAVAGHAFLLLFTAPWKLAYPYTLVEMAALAPGLALVLGLIYQRTENVLACVLLHTLVLFLPQILIP